MIRPSRLGAESERKIPATAEGSVVETTAPISRPVVIGTIPSQLSEPPIITVESTTATTASSTIGTQSSKIRRTSIPNVTWNSRVGRKIYKKEFARIGRSVKLRAMKFRELAKSTVRNTAEPTPMRIPAAARITLNGNRMRSASGSHNPTRRNNNATIVVKATISIICDRSDLT